MEAILKWHIRTKCHGKAKLASKQNYTVKHIAPSLAKSYTYNRNESTIIMKKQSTKYLLLLLFLISGWNHLEAKPEAQETMLQEYPQLMEIYGKKLEAQHAHYIFAVDISSSMQPYESVVKKNFKAFIAAIPDGDQITLIRMAREDYTDFVGLFKCITLTPETRKSLINVLDSPQFTFLKDGNPQNGSDGYTMSQKILESLNTVGSAELTFIYLFTDFEYWTSKHHYNKKRENWDKLESLLSEDRKISLCKYGLELNFNDPRLKQQAIFKDELDKIFGKIDYQAVSSAEVLSQWFAHTISNVMATKMSSMVQKDWTSFRDSLNPTIKIEGNKVLLQSRTLSTPLATGLKATVESPVKWFQPEANATTYQPFGTEIELGTVNNTERSIWPGFLKQEKTDIRLKLSLNSPVEEEIKKLLTISREDQDKAIGFTYEATLEMPAYRLWNSYIPLWIWVTVACILSIIVISILYTVFLLKVKRFWSITVIEKNTEGKTRRMNGDTEKLPYSIGRNGTLTVRGANWLLVIRSQKHNPLLFWKKSGFYLTLEEGTFAEVVDAYTQEVKNTLSVGNETFLFSHRKPEAFTIRLSGNGMKYNVELN